MSGPQLVCFILDWTFELLLVICGYDCFPVCILASKSFGCVPESSMLVIGEVSTSSIQMGPPASPGRRREPLLARIVRGLSWARCPGCGVCLWPRAAVSGKAAPLATTGGQLEPTTSLLELVTIRLYWLPVW